MLNIIMINISMEPGDLLLTNCELIDASILAGTDPICPPISSINNSIS